MPFFDFLVERGVLGQNDVHAVLSHMKEKGEEMEIALAPYNITPKALLALRGEYTGIPIRDLSQEEVSFQTLEYIPEESALHYQCIPLGVSSGVLEVGIVNPDNISTRDAIQFIARKLEMPFRLFLVSYADFLATAKKYKGLSGEVNKALSEFETDMDETNRAIAEAETSDDISKTQIIEDAPVTKIVAVILRHAIEGKASDVHVEPLEDKLRVRFRVDGKMYTSIVLPKQVNSAVVARIKILTGSMKLDEKRKPQDGRFSTHVEGRKVDFRVSTFPTYYGEKVVMRILDTERKALSLGDLGMNEEHQKIVQRALDRPYGIILITGPTGSGKTTSLYSMMNEIDKDTENVVSLEDPIEYHMNGVSQSQVRPEIGYTFASGLRSILRQDPDIILLGEIRDKETAQLAIQAALTGHMVFSTLHTNNASGVIPRLVDMGVDPYLIAPTLTLAIAQRLIPAICDGAQKERAIEESMIALIEKEIADLPEERKALFRGKTHVYESQPTEQCPTGQKGRLGVFEMMEIDSTLEEVIVKNPVEEAVYTAARKQGMITMKEDLILKSFEGKLSFDEVSFM
jgi:type IV pilus assembly protein PilB